MRKAGILLPISALKSKYGIGCFSRDAYEFIDWLREAEQTYWQILPIGPTGFGDSPYQSFSSFAGNPYYISIEELINEGTLKEIECEGCDFGKDERTVDYEKIFKNRIPLLKISYERSVHQNTEEYIKFVNENSFWLEDYALFMSIKDNKEGKSWQEWERPLIEREEKAINEYKEKLKKQIDFWKYIQFKFYSQYRKLKEYANNLGIKIIGDIPIYTALDSSDVWANKELFQLDKNYEPIAVAGCPPDGFSKNGQLWGNPLYNWEYHKKTGFEWWHKRLENAFLLFDVLRIDHFRGFDEYYSIPYPSENAKKGEWKKAYGKELFESYKNKYGQREIIAEDLGFVTDSVKELLSYCQFPGMKVFQFAFDLRDTGAKNDYLPHNYEKNSIAYTGTHDNPTIISWFFEITEEEREAVRNYLCDYHTPNSEINMPIIGAVMRSNSKICIIPIQDYLGYDSRARINKPSTMSANWTWRMSEADFKEELKFKIAKITKATGRGLSE